MAGKSERCLPRARIQSLEALLPLESVVTLGPPLLVGLDLSSCSICRRQKDLVTTTWLPWRQPLQHALTTLCW